MRIVNTGSDGVRALKALIQWASEDAGCVARWDTCIPHEWETTLRIDTLGTLYMKGHGVFELWRVPQLTDLRAHGPESVCGHNVSAIFIDEDGVTFSWRTSARKWEPFSVGVSRSWYAGCEDIKTEFYRRFRSWELEFTQGPSRCKKPLRAPNPVRKAVPRKKRLTARQAGVVE